ncbi:helix-turn-helix transcriptional regulator [Ligilactobacillus salivarius]|uniref:helix-turn-helix domain-containing protein n=1 Tax=Ligilactobacillus salivarius TaxID=1624 RepID=UPI0030F56B54
MEQEKIGKFIARRRKDLNFTQANLAEKLGITDRAVSKWENGKSMPDTALMLDLCQLLEINVNELLTGERVIVKDYKKIAEQNLIELQKQKEKADKKLLTTVRGLATLSCFSAIALVLIGALLTKTNQFLGITISILGVILIFVTAIYAVTIEHDAGYYECPNCKIKYIPTMKAVLLAPHYGTLRKMKCPDCGKKGYHKKVFVK